MVLDESGARLALIPCAQWLTFAPLEIAPGQNLEETTARARQVKLLLIALRVQLLDSRETGDCRSRDAQNSLLATECSRSLRRQCDRIAFVIGIETEAVDFIEADVLCR